MPDVTGLPSATRHSEAVKAVEDWLSGLPGNVQRLSGDDLRSYKDRSATDGWRFSLVAGEKEWTIDLLVDDRFPRSQARVALVNGPPFLTLPHVEKDGVLCILPDSAGIDPTAPVEAVCNILGRAGSFLEEASAGELDGDFAEEFNSYWFWSCSEHSQSIVSLIEPNGPTRAVRIWRGKELFLVAESEEEIKKWLSNRFQSSKLEPQIETALVVWMAEPLTPEAFPRNANAILKIVREADAEKVFDELTRLEQDKWTIVFGSSTPNGPCLCGVILHLPLPSAPPNQRPQDKLHRGFRQGKMPAQLFKARFLKDASIAPTVVERADGAWVHGRDCNLHFTTIQSSSVVVFGCGSLGGPVASMLARAGVGQLVLVDPQLMAWANVGRHCLGAGEVGQFKARALANRIRGDFPHIRQVTALTMSSEEALRTHGSLIESASLIISTMGDWAAEGALNEWHIRVGRRPPILYGWIEAFGVAGHCVLVTNDGGCLQCGMDLLGSPLFNVARWNGSPMKQEPACGATFQPYGPIESENVASLVAETAMHTLLGRIPRSTHKIWAASQRFLEDAGTDITPEWKVLSKDATESRVEVRQWLVNTSCPECRLQSES